MQETTPQRPLDDLVPMKRPLPLSVLAVLLVLFGAVATLYLPRHMGSWVHWLNFLGLVVGVGLWTTQNWARWLGIAWAGAYVIRGGLQLQTQFKSATLGFCVVFLFAMGVLLAYSFEPRQTDEATMPKV